MFAIQSDRETRISYTRHWGQVIFCCFVPLEKPVTASWSCTMISAEPVVAKRESLPPYAARRIAPLKEVGHRERYRGARRVFWFRNILRDCAPRASGRRRFRGRWGFQNSANGFLKLKERDNSPRALVACLLGIETRQPPITSIAATLPEPSDLFFNRSS